GLDVGLGRTFWSTTFVFATPAIAIEPRWYYNILKRNSRDKVTEGNAANFLTLRTALRPGWFVISNSKGIQPLNDVCFLPTWGIRRTEGKHLTYEAVAGLGFRYIITEQTSRFRNYGGLALNVHLRIGFR